MLEKAFVLNRYQCLPHVIGNVGILHQRTVFHAVQLLKFHPLTTVAILIVHDGAGIERIGVGVDVQHGFKCRVDVFHKDAEEHQYGQNADDHQRSEHLYHRFERRSGPAFALFARRRSSLLIVIQLRHLLCKNRKSLLAKFSYGNTPYIVIHSFPNVKLALQKKIRYTNGNYNRRFDYERRIRPQFCYPHR